MYTTVPSAAMAAVKSCSLIRQLHHRWWHEEAWWRGRGDRTETLSLPSHSVWTPTYIGPVTEPSQTAMEVWLWTCSERWRRTMVNLWRSPNKGRCRWIALHRPFDLSNLTYNQRSGWRNQTAITLHRPFDLSNMTYNQRTWWSNQTTE